MCTSGCAHTSTCIHKWAGTHRFTRAHARITWAASGVHTHETSLWAAHSHTTWVCISLTSLHTHHTNVGIHSLTRAHLGQPSTCVGCRTLLHSPLKMPTPTSAHRPAHTPDGRLSGRRENSGISSASRIFLSFPRDSILVLERGLN